MKRINGKIMDKEKVFRRLKTRESPILESYQLYYNHIRPHESLNGKTPSDACEIVIESNDKWMIPIQNTSVN